MAALAAQPGAPVANYASVGAWDGLHLIGQMIAATGGQRDGAKALAAAKGLQWESPRGPVKVDPATRHLVQNVYLRQVERAPGGALVNKELQSFGPQPDHGQGQ
ncbi:ABC transporter substrate-binding protein [Ideonella livida]|uniref:ABC transporter substrate-binding protein n=1 Tax=Ideonella livida TaxID=2707176 RepID=UPI001940369A|nr:ABC transporter substrate-binding protein [Ideonella livida]